MKKFNVTDQELVSVAQAIRAKTGRSQQISFPNGFIQEIGSIPNGGTTLITKTITSNGTYNATSDNADGYSSLTVSVPTSLTPLEKLYTYTVQESWESGYYTKDVLEAVLDGYVSSTSIEYLLVFNDNLSTSSYRVDAMVVCSSASTVSELLDSRNTMLIAWRNYYTARVTGLETSIRATQGTTIDVYRACFE